MEDKVSLNQARRLRLVSTRGASVRRHARKPPSFAPLATIPAFVGEYAHARIASLWPARMLSQFHVPPSSSARCLLRLQTRTVRSNPQVISPNPFGAKLQSSTTSLCPRSVCTKSQPSVSHNFTHPTSLEEAVANKD